VVYIIFSAESLIFKLQHKFYAQHSRTLSLSLTHTHTHHICTTDFTISLQKSLSHAHVQMLRRSFHTSVDDLGRDFLQRRCASSEVNTGIKWGGLGLWLIARYVAAIAPWTNKTNTELQYTSPHKVTKNTVQMMVKCYFRNYKFLKITLELA
jgi:hypothetical protein